VPAPAVKKPDRVRELGRLEDGYVAIGDPLHSEMDAPAVNVLSSRCNLFLAAFVAVAERDVVTVGLGICVGLRAQTSPTMGRLEHHLNAIASCVKSALYTQTSVQQPTPPSAHNAGPETTL